jgi:hypothetical protein
MLTVGYRWLVHPHVKLTIINETSAAISHVRVTFLFGQRTAERIEPGGLATTEIESGGSAGIYLSYRDSKGIVRKNVRLYESGENGSQDRGFFRVRVTDEGLKFRNGVFTAIDVPRLTVHVDPSGRMLVR